MASSNPKTLLITGCSDGGIGSGLALAFQKRGYHIIAGVRNPSKASDLSSLTNVTILTLDVTSKDSIASAVSTVKEITNGRGLDILINNAGKGAPSPILDADLDVGRHIFETNFWGTLAMCQAFAPQIVQAKGMIVNIASVGAIIHTPWLGLYSASKAAVRMATDTLRIELAPFGVKVVTGMVAMVRTRFHDNLDEITLPEGSMYKPVEKWVRLAGTDGQGFQEDKMMSLEDFSERFMGDLLQEKSGTIWRGGMSTTSKWLHWLLPEWVIDKALSGKELGLGVLTQVAQTKQT